MDGKLKFNLKLERNYIPSTSQITEVYGINKFNKSYMDFIKWLKSIPNITVIETKANSITPDNFFAESLSIKIIKNGKKVEVPNNLELVEYVEGNPPIRVFRLED